MFDLSLIGDVYFDSIRGYTYVVCGIRQEEYVSCPAYNTGFPGNYTSWFHNIVMLNKCDISKLVHILNPNYDTKFEKEYMQILFENALQYGDLLKKMINLSLKHYADVINSKFGFYFLKSMTGQYFLVSFETGIVTTIELANKKKLLFT